VRTDQKDVGGDKQANKLAYARKGINNAEMMGCSFGCRLQVARGPDDEDRKCETG